MSDVWLTPRWILDELGEFDMDPCAADYRPWPTAARHVVAGVDGLRQPWAGRVWLNPPYSRVKVWMRRMAAHADGVALVFARPGTDWWHETVWTVARAVLFLRGRVRFCNPDGSPADFHARLDSALVGYTARDMEILAAADLDGAFVPLANRQALIVVERPADARTWLEIVARAAVEAGGTVTLAALYVIIDGHPRTESNRHWKAKVRQQVQGPRFRRLGRGQYELRGV